MTQRTILEEIRHIRHVISEEIGHDPRRIAEYYASLQADLKSRVINRGGEITAARSSNAESNSPPTPARCP